MSVSELEAVVRLARAATAHNAGETVWEATTEGDRYILRMSSWPRAQEAIDGLAVAGWEARMMFPDGGHPRIEVRRADPDPGVPPSDRPALRDHAEVIDLTRRIADCLEGHLPDYGFQPYRYPSGENKSVDLLPGGAIVLSDAEGRAWTITVEERP